MNIRPLVFAYLLLHASLPLAAQTLPEPASSPAPQDVDRRINALLGRLGSNDFAQREQAQAELEKLDYHALAALRRFATQATDPEIKARLTQRLEQLDDLYALNPPPISLALKDATWAGMIAGLREATGRENLTGNGTGQFTLDVRDKPFWEVFRILCGQNTLDLGGYMGQLSIGQDQKHPLRNFSVAGPFLFAPIELTRTVSADYQNAVPAVPPSMTLRFLIAADPRLLVVRYIPAVLTSVLDDNHNELIPPQEKNPGFVIFPSTGWDYQWVGQATLALPPKPGSKIVTAKGLFRVELGWSFADMTIDDPTELLNKEFTFQGRKITITKWEAKNGNAGWVDFAANVKRDNENNVRAADGMQQPADAVLFHQIDADGELIGQYVSILHGDAHVSHNGKAPVKLKVIVPTKTKQIEVPFEFTNLPIP